MGHKGVCYTTTIIIIVWTENLFYLIALLWLKKTKINIYKNQIMQPVRRGLWIETTEPCNTARRVAEKSYIVTKVIHKNILDKNHA